MMRIFICCLFVSALLTACSKKDEPKPLGSVPTSRPAPVQLTITNQPTPASQTTPSTNSPKTERGIAVKNAGSLFLTFPKTWEDRITRIPEGGRFFDSVIFRPREGTEFEMMVNVNNVGDTKAASLDIKAILEKAGQVELTNSVEKSLKIVDLQGPEIIACYFVVTDKNRTPLKRQYLYLTQGYAKISGLILSFRLVSNQLSPVQDDMLEMMQHAHFVKK